MYAAPGSEDIIHLLWCNPGIGHCAREVTLPIDLSLERWTPGSPNIVPTVKLLPKYRSWRTSKSTLPTPTESTTLHLRRLAPSTLQQLILEHINSPSLTDLSISDFKIPTTTLISTPHQPFRPDGLHGKNFGSSPGAR